MSDSLTTVTLRTDQLEVVLDALDQYRRENHDLLMLADLDEDDFGEVAERVDIAIGLMKELGVDIGVEPEEDSTAAAIDP